MTDADRAFFFACCGYRAGDRLPSQYAGLLDYRLRRLTAAETHAANRYLDTLRTMTGHLEGDAARLRDDWRRRLCGFIGVPPGPDVSIHQELAP